MLFVLQVSGLSSRLPGAEPHEGADGRRLSLASLSHVLPLEELPDDEALPTGVEYWE